jgi:integrase
MATNTKISRNGKTYSYYRLTKTVGHKYVNGVKKPIKKQFTGTSKADAERKYQQWVKEKEQKEKTLLDTHKTFIELTEYYTENILSVNSKYSIGTRKLYSDAYKTHVRNSELQNISITIIRPEHIQMFYNRLNISKSAFDTVHKFLRGFFKWANANRYSDLDLSAVIIPEKPAVSKQTEIVIWTDEELNIILSSEPNYELKPLIIFALYTGMRISELLGLKYSDIDDDGIHVNRQYYRGNFVKPKMNKTRVIPIHEKIKELVRVADKRNELVFHTKNGTPLDYHNVVRSLNRFYRRIDVTPKKFHAYRATFVTRLCNNGVPIQVVSKLAGHENINVTSKYYTSIGLDVLNESINKI